MGIQVINTFPTPTGALFPPSHALGKCHVQLCLQNNEYHSWQVNHNLINFQIWVLTKKGWHVHCIGLYDERAVCEAESLAPNNKTQCSSYTQLEKTQVSLSFHLWGKTRNCDCGLGWYVCLYVQSPLDNLPAKVWFMKYASARMLHGVKRSKSNTVIPRKLFACFCKTWNPLTFCD